MPYRVGYFVGSLSSHSINRILSRALIKVAPADLEFVEIPIGGLPLYSRTTMPTTRRRRGRSRTPSPACTPCCSSRPSTTAASPAP